MAAKTIQEALELHQRGKFAEAEAIYLELLRAQSEHVDALHYLGVLRQQLGHHDHALELLGRSLKLAPRNADAWNNLGNICLAGQDLAGAETAYQNAVEFKPEFVAAWYNLGNLYRRLQRREEAVRCYGRVLELNPRFPGAYEKIALLLQRLGRADLAADAFRRWYQVEPDNPIARHMAAACSHQDTPARADDAFVVTMFDRFAENFDQALTALNYSAPSVLVGALSEAIAFGEQKLSVLDAGCGTGWSGPLLRSSARRLVGVDLSAGMLAKARQRGVYDELYEAELVAFMRAHPGEYDVIFATDTLIYFGGLDEVVAAAAAALKPVGTLAVSLEVEPPESTEKFRLHTHGRYSHGATYVREVIATAGLELLQLETGVIRQEAGADVPGHFVLARRK
ncbi:MAG: tetratricopeptide repeat protein [Pseudomonadota bacterium]